jgi:ATP-dependent Lon protease
MPRKLNKSSVSDYDPLPVLPLRDSVQFPGLINTVHVVREASLQALRLALRGDKRVLALAQADMSQSELGEGDLCKVGTISEILQTVPFPDGSMRVVLRGINRAKASTPKRKGGAYWAVPDIIGDSAQPCDLALLAEVKESFNAVVSRSKQIPPEAINTVAHIDMADPLADAVAHYLPIDSREKQRLLEECDPVARLGSVLEVLRKEELSQEVRAEIRANAEANISQSHRSFVLTQQLQEIQQELYGGKANETTIGLRLKLQALHATPAIKSAIEIHISKLDRLSDDSPEAHSIINHVECLLSLPWTSRSETNIDLNAARDLLESTHCGLEDIKLRILEYLAVLKLTGGGGGAILCFEGPPGVGKTSFAKTIAQALGREFASISLAGIRDEAEIRGHRRTYVGAQPGRIMQSLAKCSTRNPVLLLDEIDKITSEPLRSDPASALLEVLDGSQNSAFIDHFVQMPFDLSDAIFIVTANRTDGLPPALLDRMEVISFSSYSTDERIRIGRSHVFPTELARHGLQESQLVISDDAWHAMASTYALECGVRNLRRLIATVCRKAALRYAITEMPVHIELTELESLLGPPSPLTLRGRNAIGIITSLVVAQYGGDAVQIEVSFLPPLSSTPELRLTGNMGVVMRESAETALSYLRSRPEFGVLTHDVHIHAAHGERAKEGPSAGLAIALALASFRLGRPIPSDIGITGEITLHGHILPVGGIKEKIIAAHRLGLRRVIIPTANKGEIVGLPQDVREQLSFHTVSTAEEAFDLAFGAAGSYVS